MVCQCCLMRIVWSNIVGSVAGAVTAVDGYVDKIAVYLILCFGRLKLDLLWILHFSFDSLYFVAVVVVPLSVVLLVK